MIEAKMVFEGSFAEAEAKIREAIPRAGFGIVGEQDFQAVVKNKLGIDMPPYKVLYLCNPKIFWNLHNRNKDIGMIAPCHLLLYEQDGKTHLRMGVPEEFWDEEVLAEPFNKVVETLKSIGFKEA
ncbi:DUF302 domain-containing protein [Thermococcus sp. CX2]|uniref:DUF302 domain-containing protein n=1 Tax=Thermococcus sp. CX2 TaxID=163006 RepID=UPI00143AC521|nr:DUF302 domain-containing protein [Thermococcus sp. CX2]NJE85336.1 DUF302 domain-containing protein [Thermococcus sp. CX2]